MAEFDGQTWLRFVYGRPVSRITSRFLVEWCAKKELEAVGKKTLLLIWDNNARAGTSPKKRSGTGSENTTAESKRAAKE